MDTVDAALTGGAIGWPQASEHSGLYGACSGWGAGIVSHDSREMLN